MPIQEGKAAPAFTLTNARGEKVSLKDFQGQDVFVYFYPRDDTPGCTKEAQSFRELWPEFQAHNAVVLGVSPDNETAHDKFACKYDLPFPLLCDPKKSTMEKYDAIGEKNMYGKKTIGVIRSTVWIGPDGKVKKHWKKVSKAGEHPAAVLAALKSGMDAQE